MLESLRRSLLIVAVGSVGVLAGCAAESTQEVDDDDTSEAAVTAARSVESLRRGTRVLQAKVYATRPTRQRTDVEVRLPAGPEVPREVRRATSPVFTWAGSKRVVLSGDASGISPIVADGFLLVEVLDAANSTRMAAFTLGAKYPVQLSNQALSLAPRRSSQAGVAADRGGSDITDRLPQGQPFRLRLSALDVSGGSAAVGDVFLAVEDPVVEDTTWCAGAPLTSAEASALRSRSSGGRLAVTSAGGRAFADRGGWVVASEQGLSGTVTIERQLEPAFISISRQVVTIPAAAMVPTLTVNSWSTALEWSAATAVHSPEGSGRWLFDSSVGFRADAEHTTGAVSLGLSTTNRGSPFPVDGTSTFRVTNGCYQLRNLRTDSAGGRTLTVLYGTFPPAP
jgi:hypothetical protein